MLGRYSHFGLPRTKPKNWTHWPGSVEVVASPGSRNYFLGLREMLGRLEKEVAQVYKLRNVVEDFVRNEAERLHLFCFRFD